MDVRFLLNGETVHLTGVDPTRSVLDWLRDVRGLTGTKEGCNEGDCGACTVILTDTGGSQATNACLMILGHLDGKGLTTIEGLAPGGDLHPVQRAMIDHHGSQCGFCTPGFVMSLAAGHLNGVMADDDQLAGNLCRCTGYAPIIRAAEAARAEPVPAAFQTAIARRAEPAEPGSHRPTTTDALARLCMERPHATLINGATDVGLWLTKGLQTLDDVIFIDGVDGLKQIEVDGDDVRVGAGVSIEALRMLMQDHHPAFAEMLRRFASAQIRAVGTVGGNIGNGSPIADTPPVWIALGALLHLRRDDAHRPIPLEDYYVAYGRQDRQPGEFIEGISIPRQPDRLRVYKLSKRFDQDISAVLGAFNIRVEDGKVKTARIAFGGMAATPKRAFHAESALVGRDWTRRTVGAAMSAMVRDYTPISDLRASADYRLETAQNMLLRAWLDDQGTATNVLEVAP